MYVRFFKLYGRLVLSAGKGGDGLTIPRRRAGERRLGNMLMTLLGFRVLDFESNGEKVKGVQAFVSFMEEGVCGARTDKLFFRDGSIELPELQPGMTLDVAFNHRGKPEKVAVSHSSQRLNLGKQ